MITSKNVSTNRLLNLNRFREQNCFICRSKTRLPKEELVGRDNSLFIIPWIVSRRIMPYVYVYPMRMPDATRTLRVYKRNEEGWLAKPSFLLQTVTKRTIDRTKQARQREHFLYF